MRDYGSPPYLLTGREIHDKIFSKAALLWQRMAETTIRRYEKITDTRLCPVHLTHDLDHWVANHQDPAFAELIKEQYIHDMPNIYTPRLIDAWRDFFDRGVPLDLSELAADGRRM